MGDYVIVTSSVERVIFAATIINQNCVEFILCDYV